MTPRKRQTNAETLRRLRVGDIRGVLRARYGPILPDDDAGREDLRELLLPVSLAPFEASRKMRNMVEVLAPWMADTEATALIEDVIRTPIRYRCRTSTQIGEALQVCNAERERLRLWTIAPIDMSAEDMASQRKFKRRMRQKSRRRKLGLVSREEFLASSLNAQKPWQAEGVSRATWYRDRRRSHETGGGPTNTYNQGFRLVSGRKRDSREWRSN